MLIVWQREKIKEQRHKGWETEATSGETNDFFLITEQNGIVDSSKCRVLQQHPRRKEYESHEERTWRRVKPSLG